MSADLNDGKRSKMNAASTKWIVLGIVAIVFMVVFNKELKELISGAEEFTIGKDGISIKAKTVKTPLGETVLSNVAAVEPLGSAENVAYVDSRYDFQLDWPQDGSWIRDDYMANMLGVSLYIRYHQSFGEFYPNVNVVIDNAGSITIEDLISASNPQFEQMGYKVEFTEVDEETNSAVQVLVNRNFPGGLYQVQRYILKDGIAFIATASKLESDEAAFPHMYEELGLILNSFQAL